ncbi:Rieske (2Fe-2S) protein [Corynebacterium durum]|uniref:Rieske [2Fe-2S] domain protein n=1 Tax=Corynebacterium durum F0235 TaxID=1035195 RepID=L1MC89_9CORY|nr:Rieske (2Fe-2S) protein [Corynebacterium durum]EKX88571.1 rieske [2Fe-2S] domain protein [Corynebacterium durum F0235]
MKPHTCNRRLFLIGTATTFTGALLTACLPPKQTIDANDVPVGSAVIVGNFIITQPTSGVYHAYSATCPHQGAKITQVNGDTVTCTNHNSVFSITDGAPVSGPSRAGLKEAKLKTDGNNKLTPEP